MEPLVSTSKPLIRSHTPRQIVHMETGQVYYVHSGLAYLWENTADGQATLLDILRTGDAADFRHSDHSWCELHIQQPTTLHIIDWNSMLHNADYCSLLPLRLREHAHRTQELLAINRQTYVSDRLKLLLRFLARQFGEVLCSHDYGEHVQIPIPLTQETIAAFIRSTRATVSRLMKEQERDRLLRYRKQGNFRYVCVTDQAYR